MSTEVTTHVGLEKPSATDYYDIDVFNSNADLIDAEFKDYDDRIKHMESNFDVKNAVRSSDVTSQERITSMPSNTVESPGGVDIVGFGGLSAIQVIKNGDFKFDGEWSEYNGGHIIDGSMLIESNGVSPKGMKQLNTVKVGRSYLAMFYLEKIADTHGVNSFRISVDGTNYITYTPDDGWFALNFTATVETFYVYLSQVSSDWKIHEIKVIDKSAMTNSPANLNKIIECTPYWEGIKSVYNAKLVSRGKNKFDKARIRKGYTLNIANGAEVVQSDRAHTGLQDVKGGETLHFSKDGVVAFDVFVYQYDVNRNFISYTLTTNGEITLDQKTAYVATNQLLASTDFENDNFMIEVVNGQTLGVYTPYMQDEQIINGEFHSLPNGVSDDLEYKRSSYKIVKEEEVTWRTTGNNVKVYQVEVTGKENTIVNSILVDNGFTSISSEELAYDDVANIGKVYTTNSDSYFRFVTDLNVDLNNAIDLIKNTKIFYQLAEPVKRVIPINLASYEDGDVVITSDSGLIPEITFNTPLNQGAMLKNVAETAKTNNDLLQGLNNVQSAPIELTQDDPVKSVTLKGQTNPEVTIEGLTRTNMAQPLELGQWSEDGSESVSTTSIRSHGFAVSSGNVLRVKLLTSTTLGSHGMRVRYYDSNGTHLLTEINNASTEITSIAPTNAVSAKAYAVCGVAITLDETFLVATVNDELPIEFYWKGTVELSDLLIERRGENLVKPRDAKHFTANGDYYEEKLQAKPNTEYTMSMVLRSTTTSMYNQFRIRSGASKYANLASVGSKEAVTITTDDTGIIYYGFRKEYYSNNETDLISEVMIVEGTTAPQQYIPPEIDQIFLDEYLGETDKTTIEGSVATVEREWSKPVKLDGLFNWTFSVDFSGYKRVKATEFSDALGFTGSSAIMTKTNGKNVHVYTGLLENQPVDSVRQLQSDTELYLTIADTDSGWGENYEPTSDEIKAYFNGWVMSDASNNASTFTDGGTKQWHKRYQGIGIETGIHGTKVESGTNVNACPREKAYGDITETYKLRYKLAKSETYTIDLDGILGFNEGVNHLSVRTGVRREKVYPTQHASSANRYINAIGHGNIPDSPLDKKIKKLVKVLKKHDGIIVDDTSKWKTSTGDCFGEFKLYILEKDFSVDANYYVTYETLASENNSGIFTAEATYTDSTVEAVKSLLNIVDEQVKRLSIAETELAELKNVEVYEPTLLNGLTGVDVQIEKQMMNLTLRGLLTVNSFSSGSVCFRVPYKPKNWRKFPLTFDSGSINSIGHILVKSDGDCIIYFTGNPTSIYLDGITFKVDE